MSAEHNRGLPFRSLPSVLCPLLDIVQPVDMLAICDCNPPRKKKHVVHVVLYTVRTRVLMCEHSGDTTLLTGEWSLNVLSTANTVNWGGVFRLFPETQSSVPKWNVLIHDGPWVRSRTHLFNSWPAAPCRPTVLRHNWGNIELHEFISFFYPLRPAFRF